MPDQDQDAAQNVMNSFKAQSNTDPNHVSVWQRMKNAVSGQSDSLAEALKRKRESMNQPDQE